VICDSCLELLFAGGCSLTCHSLIPSFFTLVHATSPFSVFLPINAITFTVTLLSVVSNQLEESSAAVCVYLCVCQHGVLMEKSNRVAGHRTWRAACYAAHPHFMIKG
jgi:hypothetical protein